MIYITVFIFSVYLISFAEKLYPKNKLYLLLLFLAALCPAVLAGCRDYFIGTDTIVYLTVFDKACSSPNFQYFFSYYERIEIGFLLLSYLFSRISNDSVHFLTFCHLLIIFPPFWTFIKLKNYLNPVFCTIIFLLLFYNESLNLTRQYISIAFIVSSVPYWLWKKNLVAAIWVLFAATFHVTALLGILFPIYRWLLEHCPLKKYLILYVVSILFIGLVFFNMSALGLLSFLGNETSENLNSYLTGDSSGMSVSNSTLIVYLYVFTVLIIPTLESKCDTILSVFSLIALFALLTLFLSIIARPLYRLSLDFSIYCTISIPLLYAHYERNRIVIYSNAQKKWTKHLFLLLILAYWVFSVIIKGSNDTFPYSSSIIDVW